MQRSNRLNETKGSAPSYLRTHPLTTERIADIQDRVERMSSPRAVPDSFEYRVARAKVRALTGSASEALTAARAQLAERTVVRPREDVYSLALALRRARLFDEAWSTLTPLRTPETTHSAFELLAAQIRADQGRADEAIALYKAALGKYPQNRALAHGYVELLLQRGKTREAIAELTERVRVVQDDAKLFELQARAYEATGRRLSQHRAQAEAYARRGNLQGAVDQLEIAIKLKGTDFYEMSGAEARLRELRDELEIQKAAEKALKIT